MDREKRGGERAKKRDRAYAVTFSPRERDELCKLIINVSLKKLMKYTRD